MIAASSLLAVLLTWGSQHFDWIALRANGWQRVGLLAGLMAASALLYFGALWAAGLAAGTAAALARTRIIAGLGAANSQGIMSWSYDDTPTALQYFAALVQSDEHLPLMEAAISIAQDAVPDLDLQAASAELDRLQVRLVQRLAGETDPLQCLRGLNQFFYGELGFGGNLNDYYDPANSYIHHVLQTRRGIPISVALIWLELAAAIDLPAQGVSFPAISWSRCACPRGRW